MLAPGSPFLRSWCVCGSPSRSAWGGCCCCYCHSSNPQAGGSAPAVCSCRSTYPRRGGAAPRCPSEWRVAGQLWSSPATSREIGLSREGQTGSSKLVWWGCLVWVSATSAAPAQWDAAHLSSHSLEVWAVVVSRELLLLDQSCDHMET